MDYRGLILDDFQVQAIEALDAGRSVLVCAPTGTGKTVVADWMVERVLARGQQVVFTAPIKALSNQKFRDYTRMLGEERVGLVTGDLVIRRDAPVRVMTTEILRNMLLTGDQLPDLGAVIMDEIHFLDDKERGTVWEEVLIYLPPGVQVVGLSATLSNLDEFAAWIGKVRGHPVEVVESHQRAVPLRFAVLSREGGLLEPAEHEAFYRRWARKNEHALERAAAAAKFDRRGRRPRVGAQAGPREVFRALWPDGAPYMYFVTSRKDAENMARSHARGLGGSLLSADEARALEGRLTAFRESPGAEQALDKERLALYRAGIAAHHAGLHVSLKALVEELYERKLVKVLYCTGTFALGINMPARTTVLDRLVRFDGTEMIPLPAREFMQMAGRAGRRGMDAEGLVVVRADLDDWSELGPQLARYLQGQSEPVRSRFSLSFHSVVNLLHRHDRARIREIVDKSFLAFHRAHKAEQDRKNAAAIRRELARAGWSDGDPAPGGMGHLLKDLGRLEVRADESGDRTFAEFEQKVDFLTRCGYLAADGSFAAGAKVLVHIQIAEIFATELVLAGVFEGVDPEELFGVCVALCNELPRGARASVGKADKALVREIEKVRQSEVVVEAEKRFNVPVTWDAQMVSFGRWWAEGRSLGELLMHVESPTDISGDLVGAFRRAKDLAAQLRDVWAEDRPRASAIEAMLRKVTRDEVEVLD